MEFVDANVLLYAYDTAAGVRHDRAAELVGRIWSERNGALRSLSRWRIHSPLADDVVAAASWSRQYQLSFWDAMIVRSAAELHCGTLWSEDLNDGQLIEGVRVRNPFR
jgi:predicted nucleic acid-binding protein